MKYFSNTALYAIMNLIDGPQYPTIVDFYPSIIDAKYARRVITDNRPYLNGYLHIEKVY